MYSIIFFFFLNVTTTHPWCDGHSTGISAYGVWGVRVRIQVSKMKLHAHIHLDSVRVEFYHVKKNVISKVF